MAPMTAPVPPPRPTVPGPPDPPPTLSVTADLESSPEPLATAMFFTLFMGSLASLFYLFSGFVTDLILALLLSALAVDRYRGILSKVGGRTWLASALTCGMIVVVIAIPITLLITSLSSEAAHAFDATRRTMTAEQVQEFLFGGHPVAVTMRKLSTTIGLDFTPDTVKDFITKVGGTVASFIYEQVNTILSNVLRAVFHFAMIMVAVFYLLIDGARLKRFLFRLSPLPSREEELLATKFSDVGRAILVGNGVGSVLQGTFGGLMMWAFGLSSPVLWGTVMSIFAFLPLIGISVVTIPSALYLLIIGRTGAAIAFFLICSTVSLLIENVLKTKLIGSHMQMHDLLIFLSLIAGITTFGVIGILYGPLLVTLFLTLAELYEAHYRRRFATHLANVAGVAESIADRPPPQP